ncbi:MAG: hypothetical protein LAT82_03470 [Nanoarchaeota archaeon]|nr:hypothetical protein [Nanoarchaeota archaeon]
MKYNHNDIKNSKKGDVHQVFIFAVSTIVVVFVGFLVLNFVGVLGSDVEDRVVRDFINEVELDFNSVRSDFNSERVKNYRVPGRIQKVVFTTPACTNEEYKEVFDGHYLIVYDSTNQVLAFTELGEFGVSNSGCFEIEQKQFITLAFRNIRNSVFVDDLS